MPVPVMRDFVDGWLSTHRGLVERDSDFLQGGMQVFQMYFFFK